MWPVCGYEGMRVGMWPVGPVVLFLLYWNPPVSSALVPVLLYERPVIPVLAAAPLPAYACGCFGKKIQGNVANRGAETEGSKGQGPSHTVREDLEDLLNDG